MALSKIEWTDYTFNPWRGCTKVSDGCKNCYAETWSKRNPSTLGIWGDHGTRVIASESYWNQPHKWNREAAATNTRRKVFCASLADVFEDRPELHEPRVRLFNLMEATPHLDWLLLTKRPAFAREWLFGACHDDRFIEHLPNFWLGTSVENQTTADERIPLLLQIPSRDPLPQHRTTARSRQPA
jgi:protein gp37